METGENVQVGVMDGKAPVPAFPTVFNAYLGAVLFEVFLFGLYTILFVICIYVLVFCNKSVQWFLLVTSMVMYALATSDVIYTTWLLFGVMLGDHPVFKFSYLYPKYNLYVTNNLIADGLLLYRCVMVWKNKLWLMILGIPLLVGVTACGYALEGTSPKTISHGWIYLSLTLALNVALTGLTAGRILYITRQNYWLLPQSLRRKYIITVAILVESGLLYTLYLCLNLGFQKHPVANVILDCGAIQMVGIVPTLIIVQAGLGRTMLGTNFIEGPKFSHTQRNGSEDISRPLVNGRPSRSMSMSSKHPLTRLRSASDTELT